MLVFLRISQQSNQHTFTGQLALSQSAHTGQNFCQFGFGIGFVCHCGKGIVKITVASRVPGITDCSEIGNQFVDHNFEEFMTAVRGLCVVKYNGAAVVSRLEITNRALTAGGKSIFR